MCATGVFAVFVHGVDLLYLLYHIFSINFLPLVAVDCFSVEGLLDFISSVWPLSIVIAIWLRQELKDLSFVDTADRIFQKLVDVVFSWALVQHSDLMAGIEGSLAAGSHHQSHSPTHSSLPSPLGVTDAVVPLAAVIAVTLKFNYQTVQMGPAVSSSLHGWKWKKSPTETLQHSSHSVNPPTLLHFPTPISPHPIFNRQTSKLAHNNKKAICFHWAVWSWNQEWASINSIML